MTADDESPPPRDDTARVFNLRGTFLVKFNERNRFLASTARICGFSLINCDGLAEMHDRADAKEFRRVRSSESTIGTTKVLVTKIVVLETSCRKAPMNFSPRCYISGAMAPETFSPLPPTPSELHISKST